MGKISIQQQLGGGKASAIFKTKARPKRYIGNSVDTGHFSPPPPSPTQETLDFKTRFSSCCEQANILIERSVPTYVLLYVVEAKIPTIYLQQGGTELYA